MYNDEANVKMVMYIALLCGLITINMLGVWTSVEKIYKMFEQFLSTVCVVFCMSVCGVNLMYMHCASLGRRFIHVPNNPTVARCQTVPVFWFFSACFVHYKLVISPLSFLIDKFCLRLSCGCVQDLVTFTEL